jgi:hypothetical protein
LNLRFGRLPLTRFFLELLLQLLELVAQAKLLVACLPPERIDGKSLLLFILELLLELIKLGTQAKLAVACLPP